jgi:hypothetical protein
VANNEASRRTGGLLVSLMFTLLESVRARLERRRLARRVEWALALGKRGEVRADGLSLVSSRNQLVIEWHAREVHPWDRDLPVGQAADRFVQQCFEDVDAAIGRLFRALPQVDEIELKVTDKGTDQPIMRGTVTRQDAGHISAASVRMKLKFMGISYRLSGPGFEGLPEL